MQFAVTSAAWVDLGPAPLNVMPQGSVFLYQGSAAPGSLSGATLIGGDSGAAAPSMSFYGTAHVFAIAEPGGVPVEVEADVIAWPPPQSVTQSGGPWSVSWSGQSVAISNWPTTQPVSLAALPAFAATPTFNLGSAPTLAVNWSGQSVAVSNFPATQAVSLASLPALPAGSNVIGGVTQSGGPWSVSWSGQSVAATQSGSWTVGLAAGSNTIGAISNTSFTSTTSAALTNPTSTLTLPSTTTAYAAGSLAANNAAAASVVVPSFSIANSGGGALIPRLRLSINDPTSTGWGGVSVQVDLWSAAPTFANGDRGAFSPATGAASHLAAFSGVMSPVYGDGCYCELALNVGAELAVKLASGAAIYWTLQAVSATGVTGASKTVTLTPEVLN